MTLTKTLTVLSLLLLTSFVVLAGKPKKTAENPPSFIHGYHHEISGEILAYHSCVPEATSSLLIRCLNTIDNIEWETDSIPSGMSQDTLSFCWVGGYSTGTSKAIHQFHLSVEGQEWVTFTTYPQSKPGNWEISGREGCSLNFRFGSEDAVNDFFGYFTLKVPRALVAGRKTLKLKVKGDASNSRDWYMTMRYQMLPSLRVMPEAALIKVPAAASTQRIKVNIVQFGLNDSVNLLIDGALLKRLAVGYGLNSYVLSVAPVKTPTDMVLKLEGKTFKDEKTFALKPVKPITVCLLPHSHTDIGYTALQTEVERKQAQNVRDALAMIVKTRDLPEDARFKWNIEVLWGAEAFLKIATDKEKQDFVQAIKAGTLDLGGTYANLMTGLCRPEELYHLFDLKSQLEFQYNIKINSAMISDIPGYVWGLVPAMAQHGIRYFSSGPNIGDRVGHTLEAWGDKPFYWISPSGKDTVLHWAAGSGYGMFHQGTLAKDEGSRLLEYLEKVDSSAYPYDMVQVRYTVGGDNGGLDSGLCAFVQRWNEKYESPKIRIFTVSTLFSEFEKKYGKKLPKLQGDMSPYWEDGAGSSAIETMMSRNAATRLTEAEKLWSLFAPASFPEERFREAWRYVLLYSEHTWGAWNSTSDPDLDFVKDQWKIKKSFADKADSMSRALYDGVQHMTFRQKKTAKKIRVLNLGGTPKTDVVTIPQEIEIAASDMLKDDKGAFIPVQFLSDNRRIFLAREVEAFGSREYTVVPRKNFTVKDVFVNKSQLKNDFFSLKIDPESGDITALTDSVLHEEWVDNSNGFGLNAYIYSGSDGVKPLRNGKCNIRIKEKGAVVSTLMIESSAPGCRTLSREVSLYSGIPRIDLVNTVEKLPVREKENVRFAFPFNIDIPREYLDYAWTAMRPETDQLKGSNKNYYTVLDRVWLKNAQKSVTFYTPDAPLIESGGMTAENWQQGPANVSWMTKAKTSALLYSWVMNNSWHTNFKADQEGKTVFRYSITPEIHDETPATTAFAKENDEVLVACGLLPPDPDAVFLLKDIAAQHIIVSSIFPEQNPIAFRIRLFNASEKVSKLAIENLLERGYKIFLCDADGIGKGMLTEGLKLSPKEVVSLRIYLHD